MMILQKDQTFKVIIDVISVSVSCSRALDPWLFY